MPPVSVVICTWNRADSLRLTLESLGYLAYPTFEVVVVVGPCTDHTDEVLQPYEGRIKVVRTDERNLSVSRNLGIAAASGEVVAFLDDDAVPDAMWLDDLVGGFSDDEVGATGGPVFDHTGYRLQARYNLSDRWGEARVETALRRVDFLEHPDGWEFLYTMGTNSLFRRDLLIAIGGFDENFAFYLDETDVCLRLIDRGFRVLVQPRGLVHHKFLPSQIRDSQRITVDRYQVLVSRLYFAFRHGLPVLDEMKLWFAFRDFVLRHQADLDGHVASGRVPADARARFDADVERAYPVVMEKVSVPASTRPAPWFASRAMPFVAFGTVTAPPRRLRLAVLAAALSDQITAYGHALARAGHVAHILLPVADASTVDFEGGVWVHRLEKEQEMFERELQRISEFVVFDAVHVVDADIDPSRLSGYRVVHPAGLSVEAVTVAVG